MKMRLGSALVLASALMLGASFLAIAQDHPEHPKKNAQPTKPEFSADDQQKMMEAWAAVANPGEPHKLLASMVGEWDVTMRMYPAGPDGPTVESKGKSVIESVFGGRFIVEHSKGEFQMPGNDGTMQTMSFEGMGTTGYDNNQKSYISTWADSMGTTMVISRGTFNPTNPNEMYLYGTMDEPGLGMINRMTSFHKKIVDNDHFVGTMYDLAISPDYKVMELEYTRVKPTHAPAEK